MPFRNVAPRGGGLIQSRIPADRLPSRIGIAFPAGAAERPCQPFRVVDEFRCGATLGAERLTSRVSRIRLEAREMAVLDHRDCAASRNAERAIGMNAVRAG